ncbi:uncharacterized protein LOC111040376 [Myzus persicae]|uniref:uncharacterized protein LOC111040376 n=1 Tax=Myzus persicae TaxID=13164 RepID=UPI000B930B30|nr:uncharacterized protein LOC111040376 [Myzus persicae]
MYRQILVAPKYRTFQHIIWRESPHDKVQEFELNTVTYGVGTAPYLALRVLKKIAVVYGQQYPSVQAALMSQTYMDDICAGAGSIQEAQALKDDLISILGKFGLELKKWASNSAPLLENIPPEDRAAGSLPFNIDNLPQVQILGMKWNPNVDTFNYNLQCVWGSGVSWDERLPLDLEGSWLSFVDELHHLSLIQVPRFVGTSKGSQYELCGFADASIKGYAAVVYLRVSDRDNGVSMFLLGCKTKLAPTKTLSIPRLELCAAGLLARWLSRYQAADEKGTGNGGYVPAALRSPILVSFHNVRGHAEDGGSVSEGDA